jgi:mRNA interferase MazF
MPLMTIYEFGGVVLVPFPFTDQTTSKKRPAVIVSSNRYNQLRPDVILIAVTSQLSSQTQIGDMIVSNWSSAGLIKPSAIKPVLTTLEKTLVIKTLGKLELGDRKTLNELLGNIIGQ